MPEHPTIEKLKRIIEQKGEFPAMQNTINLVSRQTSPNSDTSITELTNTILKDFALSNKLLKMVNTVFFVKFQLDGKISTISRAIYLLGFTQVRNAALSLMLFEQLANKTLAADLRDALLASFMSGVIARELTGEIGGSEKEESFICALFHDLGKLLTIFYMPDECMKMRGLIQNEDMSDEEAAASILGVSYENIGMSIAKMWQFAEDVIYCMRNTPPSGQVGASSTNDKLRCVSVFANKLCSMIDRTKDDPEVWSRAIKALLNRFQGCFKVSEKQVKAIVELAFKETYNYSKTFGFNLKASQFMKKIGGFLSEAGVKMPEIENVKAKEEHYEDIDGMRILEIPVASHDDPADETPEAIMAKGVQEIANALLEDYTLNDILRMILETMFRGMKFARVIICIKNSKDMTMDARFGFGDEMGKMTRTFKFSLDNNADDVFNVAISKQTDILISDINDKRIRQRIPDWWSNIFSSSKTFILIPIVVLKVPIALIYADKEKANAIEITPQQLRFIKTLRNQAVLAIKQRM
ncbi:MAG: HDOD domain-containing protein [Nitrospirae bacterium]|nr:HDOD domain-containing protein [Nitrospirota bacterium]